MRNLAGVIQLCQVRKLGAVVVVVDPLLKADFGLIQTYKYRSDLSLEYPNKVVLGLDAGQLL
jgi:surfactin synthase thioesterase subunit